VTRGAQVPRRVNSLFFTEVQSTEVVLQNFQNTNYELAPDLVITRNAECGRAEFHTKLQETQIFDGTSLQKQRAWSHGALGVAGKGEA